MSPVKEIESVAPDPDVMMLPVPEIVRVLPEGIATPELPANEVGTSGGKIESATRSIPACDI